MRSKVQDAGALRRVSGYVLSSGAVGAGVGFSVVRTGVGAYVITFTEPFRGAVSAVGSSAQGQLSYNVTFAGPSSSSVNAYCFTTSTNAPTDAGFSFTAEGLAR